MNTFIFSILTFNAKQTNYGTPITKEQLLFKLLFSSIVSTVKTMFMTDNIKKHYLDSVQDDECHEKMAVALDKVVWRYEI